MDSYEKYKQLLNSAKEKRTGNAPVSADEVVSVRRSDSLAVSTPTTIDVKEQSIEESEREESPEPVLICTQQSNSRDSSAEDAKEVALELSRIFGLLKDENADDEGFDWA